MPDRINIHKRTINMNNILKMLEQSAIEYPDKVAFCDPTKSVTFKELETLSKKVAAYLFSSYQKCFNNNAAPLTFFMEKSVDATIAMFGGVYLNAFYSFVDIRQTRERVRGIIDTLESTVIITDSENYDNLKAYLCNEETDANDTNIDSSAKSSNNGSVKVDAISIILIDEVIDKASKIEIDETLITKKRNEFIDITPLYVNFTSGSTGMPKGVAVGHLSVCDFIEEFTEAFGIDNTDILANQAPYDFDVSVKDIYSGLHAGATVTLIPREYFSNPTVLMDYLCEKQVTNLTWAVSALCFLSIMNALEYKCPDSIRRILFSGETMPVKQLNKIKKYIPNAMYVNLYGPTEITCNCTYHILEREYDKTENIPIGIPFKNEKVFLLDENDKLICMDDTDSEGEICVAGTCLALGYYKDPEKTAQCFVKNPLNDKFNETIYRTGDLGRYDNDGNLIYTSRKDFQIKHMGQRIELGDIEACAESIDSVDRGLCLYDHKKKKIVLFVISTLDKDAINELLKDKLPSFMLPNKTIILKEFPLNKNGKIDRNKLSELYL